MRHVRDFGQLVVRQLEVAGEHSEAMNKLLILAGCVAGVAASAVTGALATDPDATYYRTWTSPAGSRRHRSTESSGPRCTPTSRCPPATRSPRSASRAGSRNGGTLIGALAVNLVLNTGWSWLFFRGHRPWLAAAECAVLTASSADLVRRVGAADRRAGFALAPYPAWCAFATALTVAIARRNPRSAIDARLRLAEGR